MRYLVRFAAFMGLALAITTGPVQAASAANGANISGDAQALIQKYQKKSRKLQKIHKKTLQNNPELKQQQEAYRDMVQAAIEDQGYDMSSGREKLQKLSKKLQAGDLPKSKRKELMQKFQSQRRQMSQARRKAMQQPEIQKAREDLKQATLAAMKEQNPKTDELISSLRNIQGKLRHSMQQGG